MSSRSLTLDGASLSIDEVVRVARDPSSRVALAPEAMAGVAQSRSRIDRAVERGETIYGVNTGFGKLAHVRISPEELDRLQVNLIRSHCAGLGDALPADVVRASMLLRANVLLRPTSGVRPELLHALVGLVNSGLVPVVPEQGSVGASGDLAPLSHIARVVMGEGEVLASSGKRFKTATALRQAGIAPYAFGPKEGLAFINGTQVQTAILALAVHDAWVLWRSAIGAAAMSLEALRGTPSPLDARIHAARPHGGQEQAAKLMRRLLQRSAIRDSHRENDPRVQDAYSLRCAPQVLGAVADAIQFAGQTADIELNASTDNPLVFDNGDVLSGGNFHGQPIAQALDILAIALTTLQGIAERRIERLVNPDLSQGLPAFLTSDPGLSSGYMMVQVSAAALVAESRSLAFPASVMSIPTDANQEDFVPMSMAAASKLRRILANARRVVAAEFLCAAQGLEILLPLTPGEGVAQLYRRIRGLSPAIEALGEDRPPAPDIERIALWIAEGALDPQERGGA
ncbi:MAG: histidine ammonia-lyase [Gemmatimonadales bacterium]|nr:histidine ammonia-lyase [Gemmatimonadales bacterium]